MIKKLLTEVIEHPLVQKAAAFAKERHQGQIRKFGTEPYFNHVERVAKTVKRYGLSPEAQAAAYLHDTVEDTPTTHDEILHHFGPKVHSLVRNLTDEPLASGNRAKRHQMNVDRLAGSDYETQSIKYADTLDNAPSIIKNDPKFAKVFVREKEHLLTHMNKGHPKMYRKALRAIRSLRGPLTLCPKWHIIMPSNKTRGTQRNASSHLQDCRRT